MHKEGGQGGRKKESGTGRNEAVIGAAGIAGKGSQKKRRWVRGGVTVSGLERKHEEKGKGIIL